MSTWSCTAASSLLLRTVHAPTYSYKPSKLCSSLATCNYSCLVAARPKLLSRVQTRVCRPLQHSASPITTAASETSVEWRGLPAWRLSDVDNRRVWGDKGPVAWKFREGAMPVGQAEPPSQPARPAKPQLVPPKQVPTPKQSPLPLPVYMLHNLAHVELNAVDLAWDTVARFSHLGLDEGFYADFARVADDESRHLSWCLQRLEELGYAYGDMVAHSILWEGAHASSGDLAGRLAVVPMSQEAKGLDAGPRLAEKLVGCGDNRTAAIVSRIALEEKAHVAVGVSWFTKMAVAMGEEAGAVYQQCIMSLGQQEGLRPPYNHASRQEVGLKQHWYDRSLWHTAPTPVSGQAHTQPAACRTGTKGEAPQHAMSKGTLQSLKQRMATVLDAELCSAS